MHNMLIRPDGKELSSGIAVDGSLHLDVVAAVRTIGMQAGPLDSARWARADDRLAPGWRVADKEQRANNGDHYQQRERRPGGERDCDCDHEQED